MLSFYFNLWVFVLFNPVRYFYWWTLYFYSLSSLFDWSYQRRFDHCSGKIFILVFLKLSILIFTFNWILFFVFVLFLALRPTFLFFILIFKFRSGCFSVLITKSYRSLWIRKIRLLSLYCCTFSTHFYF